MLLNVIPTKDHIIKRGLNNLHPACPTCSFGIELVDHLLAECDFAKATWRSVCKWLQVPIPVDVLPIGLLYWCWEWGFIWLIKKIYNLTYEKVGTYNSGRRVSVTKPTGHRQLAGCLVHYWCWEWNFIWLVKKYNLKYEKVDTYNSGRRVSLQEKSRFFFSKEYS